MLHWGSMWQYLSGICIYPSVSVVIVKTIICLLVCIRDTLTNIYGCMLNRISLYATFPHTKIYISVYCLLCFFTDDFLGLLAITAEIHHITTAGFLVSIRANCTQTTSPTVGQFSLSLSLEHRPTTTARQSGLRPGLPSPAVSRFSPSSWCQPQGLVARCFLAFLASVPFRIPPQCMPGGSWCWWLASSTCAQSISILCTGFRCRLEAGWYDAQ